VVEPKARERGIIEGRHRVLRCRPHTMKGFFMMPPHSTAPLTRESIRFWSRVDFNGPLWQGTPCWEWPGISQDGYGRKWWRGRTEYVHRIAYELLRGPIPDGLTVDHLCRNRACVNAAHHELVTGKENTLRGISPSAMNARKTHCKRGHPFTRANTYTRRPRGRGCRICKHNYQKAWKREWRAKRKEEKHAW
jgi:hypothetical protein